MMDVIAVEDEIYELWIEAVVASQYGLCRKIVDGHGRWGWVLAQRRRSGRVEIMSCCSCCLCG